MTSIIGVTHLKNEDIWIGAAIRSLSSFCDDFLVIDNGSTDDTIDIVNSFGIEVVHVEDMRYSHELIHQYIGKDVWIQGFGGDEVYYKDGLVELRERIQSGELDNTFQVYPWFLHVTDFSSDMMQATGYLAPPSHPPGKLYNFSNLDAWQSERRNHIFLERGRRIKEGVLAKDTSYHNIPWCDSDYKCLHTRFLRRSSIEPEHEVGGKLNPADLLGYNSKEDFGDNPNYNQRNKYKRGELVTVDISEFGLYEASNTL